MAFIANGIATVAGALFGTAPSTIYLGSAAGIMEGGRTGLTSVTTAAWFFAALWFAPIFGMHMLACDVCMCPASLRCRTGQEQPLEQLMRLPAQVVA